MFYRIADLTLDSQLALPSFAAFACEPGVPDVTLTRTTEMPPAGEEIVSGDIVHRLLPDGWFCHTPDSGEEGLLISGDRPLVRLDGPEVFGVPWDGKEQCFRSVRFPLKAICEIRRADAVRVQALSFSQRLRLLTRQCFLPMWDTETAAVQMRNLFRLASGANIVRAFCGPAEKDALALRAAIDQKDYMKEESDMKAKSGFVLRNVVGEYMLMPTGENVSTFKGTVLLNEVSAFVWQKLQSPHTRDELLQAILQAYDVDEATAANDLDAMLERLNSFELLEKT